jgi:hypothetical protein
MGLNPGSNVGSSCPQYGYTGGDASITYSPQQPGWYTAQVFVTDWPDDDLPDDDQNIAIPGDILQFEAIQLETVTFSGSVVLGAGSTYTMTATVQNGTYPVAWSLKNDSAYSNVTLLSAPITSCPTQPTNGSLSCSLTANAGGGKGTIVATVQDGTDNPPAYQTRLIVVQIQSVSATIAASVGTPAATPTNPTPIPTQNNPPPETGTASSPLAQGALPWPDTNADPNWISVSPAPLVFIRNSAASISLSAVTVPPASTGSPDNEVQVSFAVVRADDAESIGEQDDVPAVTPGASGTASAAMTLDKVGSYMVLAYIDSNGNRVRDDTETGTGFLIVIVDAVYNNNALSSHGDASTFTAFPGSPDLQIYNSSNCGIQAQYHIGCAAYLYAQIDFYGAGQDGLRGLNWVYGGWVQEVTAYSLSGTYTGPHSFTWEPVYNGQSQVANNPTHIWGPGSNPIWLPGDAPPPFLLGSPNLDGSPTSGTGGNSSTLVPAQKQSVAQGIYHGERFTIEAVDSPAIPFPLVHPAAQFSNAQLTDCGMNYSFMSYLVVWTSSGNGTGAPAGVMADRVYNVLLGQPWGLSGAFTSGGGAWPANGVPSYTLDPTAATQYPAGTQASSALLLLVPKMTDGMPGTFHGALAVNAQN